MHMFMSDLKVLWREKWSWRIVIIAWGANDCIMMLLSTQGLHCTLQMRIDRCVYSERHNLLCYKSSRKKSALCVWNMEKMYNRASLSPPPPQWGTVDAEIKAPSGENTALKRSPFKALSRSVYSYTCYAYPSGPFTCIFSKTSTDFGCGEHMVPV